MSTLHLSSSKALVGLSASAVLFAGSAAAQSQSFAFTPLAEASSTGFSDFVGAPAIDDHGHCLVRGVAAATGAATMLWLDGSTVVPLIDDSGSIAQFLDSSTYEANGDGLAVFLAQLDGGDTALYRLDGALLAQIALGSQLPLMSTQTNLRDASINDAGDVAFTTMGLDLNGTFVERVFLWSAGALSVITEGNHSAPLFFGLERVQLLNDGSAVLFGVLNAPQAVFLGHFSGGGTFTTLGLQTQTSFSVYNSGPHWQANDAGVAAFAGGATSGTGFANKSIVRADAAGQTLLASAQCPSVWNSFEAASINSAGQVAFMARAGNCGGGAAGARSVQLGPDPIADKVLAQGDALFGATVIDVELGNDALDDAGEIALRVALSNGRELIVIATPLPPTLGTRGCEGSSGCPCGNNSLATHAQGCANQSGRGSRASASGSTSRAADDLSFDADELTGNVALLFVGSTATATPVALGDGLRCVAAPLQRLGLRTPVNNRATWGPGLGAMADWQAGATRVFQVWYRSSTASPCPSSANTNLSSSIAITFTP